MQEVYFFKKKRARDIAEKLGYPGKKVIFGEEGQKAYTNDGREILAQYFPRDDEIMIYEEALKMPVSQLGGVVAHEVTHAQIDNGEIAMAIRNAVGDEAWKEEWWEVMKYKDGVTPYSVSMWNKMETVGANTAVRETIAEIARLEYQNQLDNVSPLWVQIYQDAKRGR